MARIAQRLIAAGASPERAAQFERQFAAARPGVKPRELEDAFDADLAAISESVWPNTFRPKNLSDEETIAYVKGIYGENKYNELLKKAGPRLLAAKNSTNAAIKTIAEDFEAGVDLGEVVAAIRTMSTELLGGLTPEDMVSQANNIYNDYLRTKNAAKNFLKDDQYYKVNLPHPKLQYGETTDLAKGVIDYRTHPGVSKVLADPNERQKFVSTRMAGVERARGLAARAGDALSRRELIGIEAEDPEKLFEKDVFTRFTQSASSPFFDEVKRRESVKGKTIK